MSWTISLWQEAIKRSWWTSDTWSSTQIGSQLKASRTTCHKQQVVFDHVSFFLGGDFHRWRNMDQPSKRRNITVFTGEKNRGHFQGLDFLSPKTWWLKTTKKSQEFQVVRFQFLFESTLVSHEEKTTEIHLGETRFIHQNWPILGQCSLNLLLLEHLCQQWGFQKMTTKNAYVHKVHAKMLMPIDNHPSKDYCSHPNGSLSWLKVHLSVFGKNGLCCFRHKGWSVAQLAHHPLKRHRIQVAYISFAYSPAKSGIYIYGSLWPTIYHHQPFRGFN